MSGGDAGRFRSRGAGARRRGLDVRCLLGGDFELAFERTTVEMVYDSVDEGVGFFEETFGPMVMARRQLEPQGRWEALHDDIVARWRRDEAPDGSVHTIAEYLVVMGTGA